MTRQRDNRSADRKISMKWWALLLVLAGGFMPPPAEAAGAMRCGSRLVHEGKHAAEVLVACGSPHYRDVWSFSGPSGANWLADTEQWYYNFGPNQLLRVLTLRDGRLIEIEAEGYGWMEGGARDCGPADILPGLSKFRL